MCRWLQVPHTWLRYFVQVAAGTSHLVRYLVQVPLNWLRYLVQVLAGTHTRLRYIVQVLAGTSHLAEVPGAGVCRYLAHN